MLMFMAIAVLSAAVIGYEILLMRLFSIVLWHHFAYMIISLALLGYGASGTFIALTRQWLIVRFRAVFALAASLFGITAVVSFAVAQRLAFNPLEIVWDPSELLYLLGLYLLLAIPFFCAATCIGLAFSQFRDRINRIYCADLLGAATGALGIVLALFVLSPVAALRVLGGAGFIAAGLVCITGRQGRWWAAALLVAGIAVPSIWPEGMLTLRLSPYKGLSQTLQVSGARVLTERMSPLGLLTVVERTRPPFRYAPGLSLTAPVDIPLQLGIFTDGDSMTAITRFQGKRESLAYLDYQTAALPYHLLEHPAKALALGAGGGSDVLLALFHGASAVDAVELNPQMVALIREQFSDFAGGLYDLPEVRVHVAEARGFVTRSRERYDIVQVPMLDSFTASAAGLYALTESTLYTVEAFEAYLRILKPGGLLAVTRWLKLPPRDSLKIFATALAALERGGVKAPARQLAMVRSWSTTTLLVKNGAFTSREIERIKAFSQARGFDLAYYPGMKPAEANLNNLLPAPYLYEGAMAMLGPGREAYLLNYKFNISPASDDRPYFFYFFKWRALPEILALQAAGKVQVMEWGYVILVATLVQVVPVSLVLILLPLWMLRRTARKEGRKPQGLFWRVVVYFAALGMAFMFIEIAFMQRFILFLSHPLYAISV
ncbi:MAG: SAM-dependent methyltransferase, partial [bacterium]